MMSSPSWAIVRVKGERERVRVEEEGKGQEDWRV